MMLGIQVFAMIKKKSWIWLVSGYYLRGSWFESQHEAFPCMRALRCVRLNDFVPCDGLVARVFLSSRVQHAPVQE